MYVYITLFIFMYLCFITARLCIIIYIVFELTHAHTDVLMFALFVRPSWCDLENKIIYFYFTGAIEADRKASKESFSGSY